MFGLFFLPSAVHSQSSQNQQPDKTSAFIDIVTLGNMVTLADEQVWSACDYDHLAVVYPRTDVYGRYSKGEISFSGFFCILTLLSLNNDIV